MKFEKEFKEWLPKNDVSSIPNYMHYIKNAMSVVDAETLDDFFEQAIEAAIKEKISSEQLQDDKKANDSRAAVRKYWSFLKSRMN